MTAEDLEGEPELPPAPDPTPAPPPELRTTSYLTQVYFRPLFGSAEGIKQLFTQEGFGNLHSIKLNEKFGFVRFQTLAEAQLFIEHFNGFHTGNTQLTVELSPRRVANHPPCKRLHISGYDPHTVTERDLYWAAAPIGFIRNIRFHYEFAFIDFDTIEEATKALDALNRMSLKGKTLAVAFAKTPPQADLAGLSIPLSHVLPGNHEFWAVLGEKFHGR